MTCLKVNEANPNDMYAGTGHVRAHFYLFLKQNVRGNLILLNVFLM